MRSRRRHTVTLIFVAVVAAAALGCGGDASRPAEGAFDARDWPSVLAAARGQTVNWYMYGGSDAINRFVDGTYGPALEERYGITLRRVPVADTVDAVNQVLSEKQAGATPGAVDLIWINGENFTTLKQAGALRTGWARTLPNARLVDWEDPALNRDFGVPVDDMESPWSSAQLQLIHDPARTPERELPRSYAEFAQWACAHPGRATYIAPGPGGFVGTRFVKGALYELSGGARGWQAFDRARWERASPALWRYLTALKPCLWRKGVTYPRDENQLHNLFANKEVDVSLTQATAGPGALVEAGTIPRGSRTFVFDANMIGDYNYVAIPYNAPHPAAALVLADLLLDPDLQAAHARPESGFGLGLAIQPDLVTDPAARDRLTAALASRDPDATPLEALRKSLAPDAHPDYQDLIEGEWRIRVLDAG